MYGFEVEDDFGDGFGECIGCFVFIVVVND